MLSCLISVNKSREGIHKLVNPFSLLYYQKAFEWEIFSQDRCELQVALRVEELLELVSVCTPCQVQNTSVCDFWVEMIQSSLLYWLLFHLCLAICQYIRNSPAYNAILEHRRTMSWVRSHIQDSLRQRPGRDQEQYPNIHSFCHTNWPPSFDWLRPRQRHSRIIQHACWNTCKMVQVVQPRCWKWTGGNETGAFRNGQKSTSCLSTLSAGRATVTSLCLGTCLSRSALLAVCVTGLSLVVSSRQGQADSGDLVEGWVDNTQ